MRRYTLYVTYTNFTKFCIGIHLKNVNSLDYPNVPIYENKKNLDKKKCG